MEAQFGTGMEIPWNVGVDFRLCVPGPVLAFRGVERGIVGRHWELRMTIT